LQTDNRLPLLLRKGDKDPEKYERVMNFFSPRYLSRVNIAITSLLSIFRNRSVRVGREEKRR
jgi:hypothetical protein